MSSAIPERWKRNMDHAFDFTLAALKRDGSAPPLFLIHTKTELIPILAAFRDADQKQAVYDLVRCIGVAKEAEAVYFVSEAWASTERRQPGETEQDMWARARQPSEREDRREVVIVSLNFRDDAGEVQRVVSVRETLRDESGVTGLGPAQDKGDPSGPGMEFLGERRPTPAQISLANALLPALLRRCGAEKRPFDPT